MPLLLLAFALLIGTSFSDSNNQMFTLSVSIADIPNRNGQVLLTLFKGEDGFPSNSKKAYASKAVKVEGATAYVRFENIPSGTYAIAALHDENSNGKLDTNMLGIPKEGYGASNNIVGAFAPPRYDDAKFVVKGNKELIIYIKKFF